MTREWWEAAIDWLLGRRGARNKAKRIFFQSSANIVETPKRSNRFGKNMSRNELFSSKIKSDIGFFESIFRNIVMSFSKTLQVIYRSVIYSDIKNNRNESYLSPNIYELYYVSITKTCRVQNTSWSVLHSINSSNKVHCENNYSKSSIACYDLNKKQKNGEESKRYYVPSLKLTEIRKEAKNYARKLHWNQKISEMRHILGANILNTGCGHIIGNSFQKCSSTLARAVMASKTIPEKRHGALHDDKRQKIPATSPRHRQKIFRDSIRLDWRKIWGILSEYRELKTILIAIGIVYFARAL